MAEYYEDMIDNRSYAHILSSCEIKAWKKKNIQAWTGVEPLQYRCSAPPTELSSQLGASYFMNS